ncbi:MAG: DUF2490 domain-containing protein [Bacteroidota bacterium]
MNTPLTYHIVGLLLISSIVHVNAQETPTRPTSSQLEEPLTLLWINTYGNLRLTKRLFWVAQTHFRFQETDNTPFVGQVAQLYNRHAISYLFSKEFNMSVGGVLRLNFNTSDEPVDNSVVPEWRIWHEYQFAMPLASVVVYHRIRIEHRWSKGFQDDSEFIFRNRWRYMLRLKIPIGSPKLSPQTFYIGPEAELIMQSGKPVIDSPMEDLRLHVSFGYILTPRVTVAAGIMYSIGQELADGDFYKQKWTPRLHLYFSPDLRKVRNKLPSIHLGD